MDSDDQFFTADSYSTDQLFSMVADDNAQHADVVNRLTSVPQPFVFGSDHHGGGSEGTVRAGGSIGEPEKRKRGRPKAYTLLHGQSVGGKSEVVDDGSGGSSVELESYKRERGRPPSLLKKQMDALGAPGIGFTPHVIMIEEGEDIASKIVSFSQTGARTVCILSANGLVSSVTLQHSPVLGGATTYEGLFEILSLSGSFVHSESDDTGNISGLCVALGGSDGHVIGGSVAGKLVAASTIQVIVGSFIADGAKTKASSDSSESGGSSVDMPPPRYSSFTWPSSVSSMPPPY